MEKQGGGKGKRSEINKEGSSTYSYLEFPLGKKRLYRLNLL